MWPDNETERDLLSSSGAVDTIAEIIVRARAPDLYPCIRGLRRRQIVDGQADADVISKEPPQGKRPGIVIVDVRDQNALCFYEWASFFAVFRTTDESVPANGRHRTAVQ
jgi:hypothetical protein